MTGVDFSVFVDKKVLGDERLVLKDGGVRSIPERENRSVIEMSDSLMLSTAILVSNQVGHVLATYHVTAVGHGVKFQCKNSIEKH